MQSEFGVDKGQVSLENLGNGACVEKFNIELEKVIENILDPNTDGKARVITLKVAIKPSEKNRTATDVEVHCSSKLSAPVAFGTHIYMGTQKGVMVAFEHNPEQMTFDDVKPEFDSSETVVDFPAQK